MKIVYLKSVDSTQLYLKKLLQEKKINGSYAVVSDMQTNGVGSRENEWKGLEGNLFLSFCIPLSELPSDLELASASIYFSYLLKEVLEESGSKVWLKWPNDFYLEDKKIGGMITNVVGETLVCGVGLNLRNAPEHFSILDIEISRDKIVEKYSHNIEKKILWKQVFSKYKLKFHLNKNFNTHTKNKIIRLSEATLEDDGSLRINGERIYSLR